MTKKKNNSSTPKPKPGPRQKTGKRNNRSRPGQTISRIDRAPAAIGTVSQYRAPKIIFEGRDCIIEHEEFVADIFADSANVFAYDTYPLNPADPLTHPWLAPIAERYETFTYDSFNPSYRGGCQTTASGKVLLHVDYDANDDTSLGTKTELLNGKPAIDAAVWSSCTLRCPRADLNKLGPRKYTAKDGSLDRTSSAGMLYVATTSTSLLGGAFLGELWISYRVRLSSPVLHAGALLSSPAVQYRIGSVTSTTDVLKSIDIDSSSSIVAGLANTAVISAANFAEEKLGLPTGWVFQPSLAAVPAATKILKFARDWAGTVVLNFTNGSTTAGPDPDAIAVAVTSLLGGASSAIPGASLLNNTSTYLELASKTTGASSYQATYVLDVAAPATTGLAFSVPVPYTMPAGSVEYCSLYPTPASLSAFRATIARKQALREGRTFLIAPTPRVDPVGVRKDRHVANNDDDDFADPNCADCTRFASALDVESLITDFELVRSVDPMIGVIIRSMRKTSQMTVCELDKMRSMYAEYRGALAARSKL